MKNSELSLNKQRVQWGIKLSIPSILLVLAATLFPYDFAAEHLARPNESGGFIAHVVLFVPLGFSLACLVREKKNKSIQERLVILISGISLSFVTEGLQFYLPRSASFLDAQANILGMFIGFLLFHFLGHLILEYAVTFMDKIKRFLTLKILTTSFLGYSLLMLLISISFQNITNLVNWDSSFPLLLGNEHTGDRPWQGYIYHLQIANKAISKSAVAKAFSGKSLTLPDMPLVCSYQLVGEGSYYDQSDHLSELVWKGDSCNRNDGMGVFLGVERWLETVKPATFLTHKLDSTSQFTLSTTIATADTFQDNHTRIVSLSGDPYHRNFTLGQDGNDLFFRLRTPLTGENGSNPELVVPDIFIDTNPHQMVVTYDGFELLVYIDDVRNQHSLKLAREADLFKYFFFLKACYMSGYKMLFYGLVFIPLSILFVLIVQVLKHRHVSRSTI